VGAAIVEILKHGKRRFDAQFIPQILKQAQRLANRVERRRRRILPLQVALSYHMI
jgi:hypothetical protein